MRIEYFVTHFPYEDAVQNARYTGRFLLGGSPHVAHRLALSMAARGHHVEVFTTSLDSASRVENYNGITIHRYGTNLRLSSTHIAFGMFRSRVKHKVDVVHGHFDVFPGPFASWLYAKRGGYPLILTYHGDWDETYGSFIRRAGVGVCNKYLVEKLLTYAKVIVSPSEQYIDNSRFLGKFRHKVVPIPNGVDLGDFDIPYSKEECRARLGLPDGARIILFVGSLTPYKGPDVLIEAMCDVTKSISNARLILVGSGELQESLRKKTKKLRLDKDIEFVGRVNDSLTKALYYRSADIFVLPSTSSTESFGIVNLEAMASGIPIVASIIGGIPGVVKDGENGLLVPPKNPGALAEAIVSLLKNEELRDKMSKEGRKMAQNYSWERIAEETERVYQQVIGGDN